MVCVCVVDRRKTLRAHCRWYSEASYCSPTTSRVSASAMPSTCACGS